MNNNSQLSLANRKQLTDLLADKYDSLRYRTKQTFHRKEQELRQAAIREYAEKNGVMPLIDELLALQDKTEKLTARISDKGFRLDDDEIDLNDHGSELFNKFIDQRIEKQLGKADDIDARFDSTMVAMMTVATLADAEKLLKSVTEL